MDIERHRNITRCRARREGRELPPFSGEELRDSYEQDLDVAAGMGVVVQPQEGIGWQSEETKQTLEEWVEDAQRRLNTLAGGATPRDVYERHSLK